MSLVQDAITEFADTLFARFPPYREWTEFQNQSWAEDMIRELSCFSVEVIKRAQRDMVRTRKPRDARPPMVSECLAACVEARRWLQAQENKGRLPGLPDPAGDEWSTESLKLAYEINRSGIGKQAALDQPCWSRPLWHFVRKHKRGPMNQREIDQCKREASDFWDTYDRVLRMTKVEHFYAPVLEKLGDSMAAKYRKLADEALGR